MAVHFRGGKTMKAAQVAAPGDTQMERQGPQQMIGRRYFRDGLSDKSSFAIQEFEFAAQLEEGPFLLVSHFAVQVVRQIKKG